MKAAYFKRFGSARDCLVIDDIDKPTPASGEVLVRLHASGVNPSDVKKRAGAFPDLVSNGYVIPHSDGAGVIEAIGDGVDSGRVGNRVFVYQAQHNRRFGTASEWVCVPDERAPVLPDAASFEVGACIGIPIMTAHRCVFADGDANDKWVLVTGGAGRVGYYAIQWLVMSGARVMATASNEADHALCMALGAHDVVNHRAPDWGSAVFEKSGGQKMDRAIDVEFGANLPEVLKCIRIGGTIATYSSTEEPTPRLPFRDMMFMDLSIRMVIVYDMPEYAKQAAITDTRKALEQGHLQHRIANTVPLADIAHAHELIEQGGMNGCVVLQIS